MIQSATPILLLDLYYVWNLLFVFVQVPIIISSFQEILNKYFMSPIGKNRYILEGREKIKKLTSDPLLSILYLDLPLPL